jgi:hypothetical protein
VEVMAVVTVALLRVYSELALKIIHGSGRQLL